MGKQIMNSMTGFGRAERKNRNGKLALEITSVNNRFLEYSFRLPRPFHLLEPQLRAFLDERLSRGKVTVTLSVESTSEAYPEAVVNETAARAHVRQLKRLQKELGLAGEITVADLLVFPDIFQQDREEPDATRLWREVKPLAEKALRAMIAMRAKEGKALQSDITSRLKTMSRQLARIEKRSTGAVELYRERLRKRVKELQVNGSLDEGRLEQEIMLFADRTDIAEECIRLKSHVQQFLQTMKGKQPVGRRLNFLLQEMNRETNTIGSKSADFDISSEAIALKEEIEKIREQVQNIE
ncbi:MAG: YicC family protein [Candidatus Zixiibacteriota bacterium]|nr:MAG: YicC family protein [candidate division Zixibacteria bacterium]